MENKNESFLQLVKKTPKDYILYSAIIGGGIIIDQITKILASTFLKPIYTLPIIEDIFHFTYRENTGMAFGMLKEHRWVFMLVSTILIIGLGFYLFGMKSQNRLYDVSIAMILSGGIGNMIDRIFLGYVVDFIDCRFVNFAVFNGADSFVCVGSVLLMLALVMDLVKEIKLEKEKAKEGKAE